MIKDQEQITHLLQTDELFEKYIYPLVQSAASGELGIQGEEVLFDRAQVHRTQIRTHSRGDSS
jgi:hypothetical protein